MPESTHEQVSLKIQAVEEALKTCTDKDRVHMLETERMLREKENLLLQLQLGKFSLLGLAK